MRAARLLDAGSRVQYSDMHFDGVHTPEASIERIAETKRLARALGRNIQVWTPVGIVCRPSQREADAYVQYVVERADWGALGYLAETHASDACGRTDPEGVFRRVGTGPIERRVLARGAYCAIGDPDTVGAPTVPATIRGLRRGGAQLCRLPQRAALFCPGNPTSP